MKISNLIVSPCFKSAAFISYYHRDQDYREHRRFGEQSDYAGGLKVGNRIEDRTENGRKKFPGYNNVLEEQV